MNPEAILALISQLYDQLSAAQLRIQELEAAAVSDNGDESPAKDVEPNMAWSRGEG